MFMHICLYVCLCLRACVLIIIKTFRVIAISCLSGSASQRSVINVMDRYGVVWGSKMFGVPWVYSYIMTKNKEAGITLKSEQ